MHVHQLLGVHVCALVYMHIDWCTCMYTKSVYALQHKYSNQRDKIMNNLGTYSLLKGHNENVSGSTKEFLEFPAT